MKLKELLTEEINSNLIHVTKLVMTHFKKAYISPITMGSTMSLSTNELKDFAKHVQKYEHKTPYSYGRLSERDISGKRLILLQDKSQFTDIVEIKIVDDGDYIYFYNTDSPDKNASMYDLIYTISMTGQHKNYIKNILI